MIEPKDLRELIDYDPNTGAMVWRVREPRWFSGKRGSEHSARNWNARCAGKPAINSVSGGYLCGGLLGKPAKAHRVAFAIGHTRWPVGDIDHVNGNTLDNRLSNLRECTRAQNALNCRAKAGFKGVRKAGNCDAWRADIRFSGRRFHLGYFSTAEAAANAYDAKAIELHGEYACLNFPTNGERSAQNGGAL